MKTTAEAYYNTVLKERSPVLETVAEKRRILLNNKNTQNDTDVIQMDSISEQSHFIARPTAPVSWASLSDKDLETAIAALEAAVLDETGINFGLCEKSWAANHLLCEAWNNLMNDARKVYADYQEKLGAEIDGVLDGSSLQEPLETGKQEGIDLKILKITVAVTHVEEREDQEIIETGKRRNMNSINLEIIHSYGCTQIETYSMEEEQDENTDQYLE